MSPLSRGTGLAMTGTIVPARVRHLNPDIEATRALNLRISDRLPRLPSLKISMLSSCRCRCVADRVVPRPAP
jgi:hypothetical protein